MANKKINQLSARVGLASNDLVLIGDPDTGFSYKTTVVELLAAIALVTNVTPTEIPYTADGTEGSSFTFSAIAGKKVIGIYRGGTRCDRVLSLPASGQCVLTAISGLIQFNSGEPLVNGERVIVDTITIS